jgi:hypothetical protein
VDEVFGKWMEERGVLVFFNGKSCREKSQVYPRVGNTQHPHQIKKKLNKGVCHTDYGLAIYIKKYLKAKEEELWRFKYFTMQKYM